MIARDIVLANLAHRDPPRPGMNFEGPGRRDDFAVFWPHQADLFTRKRWVEEGREYYDDEWGNLWVRMADGCANGEICRPALGDWRQLATLVLPPGHTPQRVEKMREFFARQPSDKFKLAAIGCWVFEAARYLRKMEVYLADLSLYPDEVDELHRKIAALCEDRLRAAADAGADGVFILEDLGTQTGLLFSPKMFRRYFKDLYAGLIGKVHEWGMKFFLHSCGKNDAILDDLIDCGVDCFQFDQPLVYDLPALADKLRTNRVALWSPIDIQKVLPTGDRPLIERETRRLIEMFRGGLILKNYPDLPGIGVLPEWDQWAYDAILDEIEKNPTAVNGGVVDSAH
jgi:uroporphyrinogen decarboxylase